MTKVTEHAWEFSGGLVIRTGCFHCRGPGSRPGRRTGILQATWWYSKKNKLNIKLKYVPTVPLLGIYPGELKQILKQILVYVHLQQDYHNSQKAETNVYQQMSG